MSTVDSFDKAVIGGIAHRIVPEDRLKELLRIEALTTGKTKPLYEPKHGECLKDFLIRGRSELGLKQKDIPLSQGYISKIENGEKQTLRPTTLKKLIDCFTKAQPDPTMT